MDFQRGDLIEVHWADIFEDVVGDPSKAALGKRISIAYYWDRITSLGLSCLVTTTTIDEKDHSQSGYCIYPESIVLAVKKIRKARVPRRKVASDGGQQRLGGTQEIG